MTSVTEHWNRPAYDDGATCGDPQRPRATGDAQASKACRVLGVSRSRRGAAIVRRLPGS